MDPVLDGRGPVVAAGAVARRRRGGLAVGMVLTLPWAFIVARWIRRWLWWSSVVVGSDVH